MSYLINHRRLDEVYNANSCSTMSLELAPLSRRGLFESVRTELSIRKYNINAEYNYPHGALDIDDILFPRVEKHTYSFVYIAI